VSVLHVHGGRDLIIPLDGVARSPIDPAGFPPARTSIALVATADRCTGRFDSGDGRVEIWRASGCAASSRVELLTSGPLAHTYPIGRGSSAYGVDMGTLMWDFLGTVWQ